MPRDDFTEKVKRILAERSGQLCNNLDCRRPTAGPHSTANKSLRTGVASHICAASRGGPRFDPNQSPKERSSLDNAIHLCAVCADMVDKDPVRYPVDLLREWRDQHEEWVGEGASYPPLPIVTLATKQGLSVPSGHPVEITGADCARFREHVLSITNISQVPILDLELRIQFPEPLLDQPASMDHPPGVELRCQTEKPTPTVQISGGGTFTSVGARPSSHVYRVEANRVPVSRTLRINLLSIKSLIPQSYEAIPGFDDLSARSFIQGSFPAEWRGGTIDRRFIVPLEWAPEARLVRSLPGEEDTGERNLVVIQEIM